MGRPRRLGTRFIKEERKKLASYRQVVRSSHRRQVRKLGPERIYLDLSNLVIPGSSSISISNITAA